ncbi:Protein of unknown function (DUF3433) [Teratosphaeria destructans]|uniref:Phosphoribosylaminoimidazole-succinocarboxamide synthase n=1 Tax=Teratosphaeria destructans TaxID=418781 RepID=A0A9W7W5P8_9PEZI|nr:Protein of unknown function (DUF3433) [Teratosphaeria destructans]
MPTTETLTPNAPFAIRPPNVSQPSIVHSKPSQQSITASEDYYSLSNSGSSTRSADSVGTARAGSVGGGSHVLHRFVTPPERYRTPAQSRDCLPQAGAGAGGTRVVDGGDARGEGSEESEVRKTPMRGEGRRRDSIGQVAVATTASATPAVPLRGGGAQRITIPRRPVPTNSRATESPASAQTAFGQDTGMIDPRNARSSVAIDLDNDPEGVLAQRGRDGAITPGMDDGPYIRFALDQLTRDEEVRGSRGYGSYPVPGAYPVERRAPSPVELPAVEVGQAFGSPAHQSQYRQAPRSADEGQESSRVVPAAAAAAGAGAAAIMHGYEHDRRRSSDRDEPVREQRQARFLDDPPPRNPNRPISRSSDVSPSPQQPLRRQDDSAWPLQDQSTSGLIPAPLAIHQQQQRNGSVSQGDDALTPVPDSSRRLTFVPGILRPVGLALYLLAILAYVVCLMVCAGWSLTHQGLWAYHAFGDVRYFVFQYLPILLGVILFFWTVQVEVALCRIAPFVAMSSSSPKDREIGRDLPLTPKGFVLPYLGHLKVPGLKMVGLFLLVAWLQIWTVPLLASSFNVHYFGSQALGTGGWVWIATQGPIWACVVFYLLLATAVVLLAIWLELGRRETGLQWDPRSLADIVVLLARSNALNDTDYHAEPARLGFWRMTGRPQEVFHTYGVSEKAARRYSLQDGQIRETRTQQEPMQMLVSRYSIEPEMHGAGADDEQRHSREKMLPRDHPGYDEEGHERRHSGSGLIPWFLQPVFSSLWAIIAIVLLLAFLIVSYLPSTGLARGFHPDVPTAVNRMGFSGGNFLYSFIPALLGMLCLLFWLDIDYAWRRLQVFEALARTDNGEVAEKSLLLSYMADLPGFVTASALVNGHWRVAVLSLVTLVAAALPILAGGVFWAQFYVSAQRTKISIHPPAYYALTVFAVLYTLAYFLVFPGKKLREASHHLSGNAGTTFSDTIDLVRQSRMLDDFAFHSPASKVALVTRLLSATPGAAVVLGARPTEAAASRVSLADSIRGFGRARQQATGAGPVGGAHEEKYGGSAELPRYALADSTGRDGGGYYGVDRVWR